MRRRAKPGKQLATRKSPKTDDARVRDLEKRLAEALKGKAEALTRESEGLQQLPPTAGGFRGCSTSRRRTGARPPR